MCFLTEKPCSPEVFQYLKHLDTAKLYELGGELGLSITELKGVSLEQLPFELCERWLRQEDDTHQRSDTPNWSSLVRALRSIGASGVACKIEQDSK